MRGYAYRLYKNFEGDILAIPGRTIAFFFFLLLFFIPLITQDPYLIRVLIFTNIFAIFAASWGFLAGGVGQLSLGHGAFFGVAAYTAGLLNLNLGLPPWATIPIGAVAAVLMGLIVGIPALRLRGHYLALVTLAFPIILTGFVFVFADYTGGELGVWGIDPLSGSRIVDYYLTLLVMLGSVLIMWKLTDAKSALVRVGIIFHALREDEITARASGINTIKYKLLAFSISGFFAGVAGSLYVHVMRIAGPSTLEVLFSFQPIIWGIFGGIATIAGPVTGAYILYPLMEFLRIVPELRILIFALIIIFVLLFMPEGVVPRLRDRIEEECPRCKLLNPATRRYCRACDTLLHLEGG